MKKSIWILTGLFFAMLTGCSYLQGYIDIAKDKGISTEYRDVLKKWTREKMVHSQFETRVHVSATYKSLDFQQGYQKEYTRIYSVNHQADNENRSQPAAFDPAYKEFFIYAYIPEKESNDFDRQRSIWKISLINEGGQISEPVEIRKVSKVNPIHETFYPYIKKYYGNCYYLKFRNHEADIRQEANAQNKPFKLVFSSVLGRVELTWD
ncbi:MAG: hypothetical protein JW943_04605 [Deltaproteobacteria bacterium]|nr:hypothetical protein [Deltaproteobacteria bacterium]